MGLEHVSARFDRSPMWDAYTGKRLKAKCQMTSWDSPRRDGLTTIRRTLSMAAQCKLPERHAVVVGGQAWIVSPLHNPDTWGGHTSRVGYIAQAAVQGVAANTVQVLSGGGTEVYLSRVWVKDVKDITTTSEAQGQYYVYFARGEPVTEGGFVYIDGRWHVVRNIIAGTAGLMVAECNELEPDCITDVETISDSAYDPVTETYTPAAAQTFPVIRMAWRDDYAHHLPSRENEQIGDTRLRVRESDKHFIRQDGRLKFDGVLWQVVEIGRRRDGSVSVTVRRV
jgi:hypothetical protein